MVEDADKDRITIIAPEIGLIAEIEVNLIITTEGEETFTITEIIDPTIELGVSQEMAIGMEMDTEGMVDITIDQIIEETIIDNTMETKDTGIEAQVKTVIGLGPDIEIIPGTALGMGPTIETKVGIETDQAVEMKDKGTEQFLRDRNRENRSTTRSGSSSHVKQG